MSDTVEVHISIDISVDDTFDTGMTVDEWNGLGEAERSRFVKAMWEDAAGGHDNGGMKVITDGAEEI